MLRRHWLSVGIFLLALAVRGLYAPRLDEPLIADEDMYVAAAQNLAAGRGFFFPLPGRSDGLIAYAYVPPLYPLFVAVCFVLAGWSLWSVKLAQAVLGAAACLVLGAAAAAGFRRRYVGTVTSLLAAVYWPFVFVGGHIITEALLVPLLGLVFWAHFRAREEGTLGWAGAAGFGWGALVLLRLQNLIFTPLAAADVAWRRWRAQGWSPALRITAAFAAGVILLFAPWAARNAFHGLGPLDTHSGYTAYYFNSRFGFVNIRKARQKLEAPTEAAESALFWQLLKTEIRADPAYWWETTFKPKALRTLGTFALSTEIPYPCPLETVRFWRDLTIPLLGWTLIGPLAVLGLLLAWRTPGTPVLILFALSQIGVAVVMLGPWVRFRMPVEVVALMFASVPIAALASVATDSLTRRRRLRKRPPTPQG